MIERLPVIKNVGTFKSHNKGDCELRKLTFIFGENSQGKSTITDILKSYHKDNPQIIIDRKTSGSVEDIEIKICTPNKGKIEFKSNLWSEDNSGINPKDIQIFDTEFVQNNVFTNSRIDHGNKENFTEFVLGEKSIKINKELDELDEAIKILNEKQDSIKKLITEKNNGLDFDSLIKIKLITDEEAKSIDTEMFGIKGNIANANNNTNNIAKIKSLPLPNSVNINTATLDKLGEYETFFQSEYSFSNEDIMANFKKHKQKTFNNESDADIWLSKGTEIKKGDSCPFCGNNIKDNFLVSSYLTIFCEDLKIYNKNIDWLLDEKLKLDFSDIELLLSQNKGKIEQLRLSIIDSKVIDLSKIIETNKFAVDEKVKNIKDSYRINEKIFEEQKQEKKENRYNAVQYDCSLLKLDIEELNKKFEEYNSSIETFNIFTKKYLEDLSVETLRKEIESYEKTLKEKQYLYERNNWSNEIKEYLELEQKIKTAKSNKKTKKEEFDIENNAFLINYFESVNKYFNRLNSKNFIISKEETTRGKKKVYSLLLKYREKVVDVDKLSSVLSESDRRALALSIFLSAVEQNANSNIIILFDDPIVSFDIDRMNEFVNIIKEFFNNSKQIIVFTHYENFYKLLVQSSKKQQNDRSLIKIKHKKETNTFEMIDVENEPMLLDEFQKIINRAISFINENCDDYTSNEGRILMEKILGYRFAKEMADNIVVDIEDGLDKFLLDLKDKNKIIDDVYIELENKRVELNGPSHTYESHTLPAKRNCIRLLWDSLHKI